jgi:hypothetical protein
MDFLKSAAQNCGQTLKQFIQVTRKWNDINDSEHSEQLRELVT